MGFCKDCKYYGDVDDYYPGTYFMTSGCILTDEPKGDYDSCEYFMEKTQH